ncbi:hypothetical protein [Ferviditalea candida]|uniref:Uncharacterized protein n=1 Tax=Ferviditalea candida TaxID=3108399 RepID=A0ABU5ZNT7_9BACL|nr:hypothetical protein [Paenibacillaceae bacterium T2]
MESPVHQRSVGVVEGDAVPQLFIPKLIEFYLLDEINQAFEERSFSNL